jgi:hypothetical protein
MNTLPWFTGIALACRLAAADVVTPPDGSYQLRVTHQARLQADNDPLKPIPSAQYQPTNGIPDISVRISDGGKHAVLMPGKISGALRSTTNAIATYQLTEGLFAGGSLTVEKTESGWMGTFTRFGSGRPILSSVRGPLSPQPSAPR